jgi:hypothetical protein
LNKDIDDLTEIRQRLRRRKVGHTIDGSSLKPSAASRAYRPCKNPIPSTDNSCTEVKERRDHTLK